MESNNGYISENTGAGYVRIMHAVPDAPSVDVYANDMLIASNLAFGMYTDYMMVPAETYNIGIYAAGTMEDPVLTGMLTIENNDTITAVAAGTLDTITLLPIMDANVPAIPDKALVRFIHLSPNAPAVDITLPDGTIVFGNVPYEYMTAYLAVDPMVYTLQVRLAGTDTVVLTVPEVDVMDMSYYSIYAIGLVGEEPALEALLVQDGIVR